MDCLRAKEELSAYLDDMLGPEEKRQMEQHISSCVSCAGALAALKRYSKTMAALPKVKAPEDFLKKVKGRIERRSEFESVMRGFFKPSANKTRAGAVLVTVVAIFAVYRIIAPQFSIYRSGPVAEKRVGEVQLQGVAMLDRTAATELGSGAAFEEKAAPVSLESVAMTKESYSARAPADVSADSIRLADSQEFAAESTFSKAKKAMYKAEAKSLIKLNAKLIAVDAAGSAIPLNDAIDKITQNVVNASGRMLDLFIKAGSHARLRFNIPTIAYSSFMKQLEQIAAVEDPKPDLVPDSGSIDLDLTIDD